jgi:hypothetical protein
MRAQRRPQPRQQAITDQNRVAARAKVDVDTI